MRTSDLKPCLAALKKGNDALRKLGACRTVDYDALGVADAYALKFHLPRADNLAVAPNHSILRESLPRLRDVLDLGSGTGSLAYALAAHGASAEGRADRRIVAVERSASMATTALDLFEAARTALVGRFSRLAVALSRPPAARNLCDLVVASRFFAVPVDEADAHRQISTLVEAARPPLAGGPSTSRADPAGDPTPNGEDGSPSGPPASGVPWSGLSKTT